MTKLIDDPILLTKKLIGFKSITPDDGGSLKFIASIVEQLGFQTNIFSTQGVTNLFARWSPKSGHKRTLAFNGHVDVVPPGRKVYGIAIHSLVTLKTNEFLGEAQ